MTLLSRIFRSFHGRTVIGMLGLLLLLAPLAACGGGSAPTPLQSSALDLGIPTEAMNSPVVGPLPDATKLAVRVTFKIDPKLLKQMNDQKIEPGKRSHIEEFASKLGVSDSTYQKIKDFFIPTGISLKLSKLRTHLAIDAKASTLAKLLQTKFVVHKYNDHTFYAPATPPKLPKAVLDSIEAITGLDNYSAPPQHAFTFTAGTQKHTRQAAQNCQPQNQTLLPRQVAHAYGYDQLWNKGWHGENMTVNLVEIDGFQASDIQNYFQCINFQGKLSTVDVDGAPTEALGESTLDIQMIAGLARSINIVDYQTDSSGNDDIWVHVNDELQQILNDNTGNASGGSVVSISLGAAESQISSSDMRAIDQSLQQLTQAEHMTVFIASGDCGAFTTRRYGDLSVSFPASDSSSVAVGGTLLATDRNGNRANEIVWSDGSNKSSCKNSWGSGGGNSRVFGRPSWQNASGVSNQYSKNMRQVPDVSAVAYALAVYYQGGWGAVGGTSAAAPIWATGNALVNQGMIQQTRKYAYGPQLFYYVYNQSNGGRSFFDVTRGNNLYFPATTGWDYSTGLGTPNLADFYNVAATSIK